MAAVASKRWYAVLHWGLFCKAEESNLSRILVETVILLSMQNQADTAEIVRDAAQVYKVDIEAISATVKQEFAAKEKAKATKDAARDEAAE